MGRFIAKIIRMCTCVLRTRLCVGSVYSGRQNVSGANGGSSSKFERRVAWWKGGNAGEVAFLVSWNSYWRISRLTRAAAAQSAIALADLFGFQVVWASNIKINNYQFIIWKKNLGVIFLPYFVKISSVNVVNFEKRDKSLQMIVLQPHEYVFIAPELQHALANHVSHKNQKYFKTNFNTLNQSIGSNH